MNSNQRVVIVTGAGSGIGYSIAKKFDNQGDLVVIAEWDVIKGAQAAESLTHSCFIQTDVSLRSSVDKMISEVVDRFGKIDVLVNNAGISRHQNSLELEEERWKQSIDVMLNGVFYCSQSTGREMIKTGGGNIINITSINSTIFIPGRLGYSCAKSAVLTMTKILAAEWAPYQIRVNAISPGVTVTPLMENMVKSGVVNEDIYLSRIPMGRFAQPEEIAESCFFIASEKAAYITGNNLIVDGGWTSYNWTDIEHIGQISS